MEISKVLPWEYFFLRKCPEVKREISFDFFRYKYAKVKIHNKLLMIWQLDRFDLDISYINEVFFINGLNEKEQTIFKNNSIKKNSINTLKFVYEGKDDIMDDLTSHGFYKSDANIIMKLSLEGKNFEVNDNNISFRQFIKGKDDKKRCDIQNEVFYDPDRIPLTPRDIAYEYSKSFFIDDMALFITINGKEIGYGQILILDGNYTIANLGVLKKYQGKGYGKKLLAKFLNLAKEKGLTEVSIRVKESNKIAYNMYKSFGFKEVSKINSS